ncbi:hypothetical protein AAC387_Pa07g3569 [Persea americana]
MQAAAYHHHLTSSASGASLAVVGVTVAVGQEFPRVLSDHDFLIEVSACWLAYTLLLITSPLRTKKLQQQRDCFVFLGEFSHKESLSGVVSASFVGFIDPLKPQNITWELCY